MNKFRFIFTLIAIVILMNIVNAQNKTSVERKVMHLKEFLSLTDEQTAKITDILSKAESNVPAEKAGKPLNKRTMMKETRARLSAIDKEIEPILTPDQLNKYDSYKKERMNQMRGSTKGRKFKDE